MINQSDTSECALPKSISKSVATKYRSIPLAILLCLVTACLGCNSGQLPTYPVEGTVQFADGTVAMFGDVEFYNAKHELNARGKVNRDGTFTVGTFEDNDGAVVGKHKIVIIQMTGSYLTEKHSDQIKHDHGELISPRYFDYRTSGLECTITPGTNKVDLKVKKNPRQTEEGMPEI